MDLRVEMLLFKTTLASWKVQEIHPGDSSLPSKVALRSKMRRDECEDVNNGMANHKPLIYLRRGGPTSPGDLADSHTAA